MAIIRNISLMIIGLFVLSIWSNLVFKNAENKGKPGVIQKSIRSFSTFPAQIKSYWKDREYINMSQTYINPDPDFTSVNNLKDDLFILNGHWDELSANWIIDLKNLKNGEVTHEWRFDKEIIQNDKYNRPFRDQRPLHTLLYQDQSIVVNISDTENLIKLDQKGNVVWQNEELGYHHAMNKDSVGDIWICASTYGLHNLAHSGSNSALVNLNGRMLPYLDNIIAKVDQENGELKYQKSVSDILIENNLDGILYNSLDYRGDPIHLNDIQPALTTTKYWNEGDLFISIRNLALIILYSPETDNVKKVITGPFIAQHDVDIINDSSIAVFDNRINVSGKYVGESENELTVRNEFESNRIVSFDFSTNSFSFPYTALMEQEKIDTESEGLFEYLSDGRIFIEEQNTGKVYVVEGNEVIFREQFPVSERNKVHLTNWIRPYTSHPLQ